MTELRPHLLSLTYLLEKRGGINLETKIPVLSRGVCVTAESPTYIDVEHSTLEHITEYTVKPSTLRGLDKESMSASHFARHPTTGVVSVDLKKS